MKPSLQVRLSQHLALTPQLQQSIRLLQLSTLELHQEVEQMLEQNPFLETEDDGEFFDTAPVERSKATEANDSAESAGGDGESPPEVNDADFGTTEREDWENGTERDDFDGIRETPSSATPASYGSPSSRSSLRWPFSNRIRGISFVAAYVSMAATNSFVSLFSDAGDGIISPF